MITVPLQMLHFTEHNQPAFDELAWAVRTNGNAWKKTHEGLSQFEWLQRDPKEEHKFSKAMQQVDGLGEIFLLALLSYGPFACSARVFISS